MAVTMTKIQFKRKDLLVNPIPKEAGKNLKEFERKRIKKD